MSGLLTPGAPARCGFHVSPLAYKPLHFLGKGVVEFFQSSDFSRLFFKQQNSCFRLKSYLKPSTYKRIKAVLMESHTLSSLAMTSLAVLVNKV